MDAPPIGPWAPAPSTRRATVGVLDLWRADLAAASDGLEDLLCADERERARRMRGAREQRLWIRSRGVLRALLGRYLDRDPRTLRFALGPHGKPALCDEGAWPAADLRFNLSHSGPLALYAVTAVHAVGIDVEVARREIDELAIAARVLGREQAQRLSSLDPEARTRAFLRAWVANEAAVKCRGTGLAEPGENPAGELWTAQLDLGPRAAAAVAGEGQRCEPHCWEWRG